MASLRDRLAAIRKDRASEKGDSKAGEAPADPGKRAPSTKLPGFDRVAADVYRRETSFPLAADELERLEAAARVLVPGTPPEGLLFYDTETTGLSGGAGTLAFLFGAAWLERGTLGCVQLFLADYPGEAEYLGQVEDVIVRARRIVSYNGRTFDGPLLRTRFVLNRMAFELPPQFDLLFDCRRIWKGCYEDCSLGTLEREVLGKRREVDIPGSLAPMAYFDYLKTGDARDLLRVFEHNLEDVLSLAALFGRVGSLVLEPLSIGLGDPAGLGILAAERNPGKGLPFLEAIAASGNQRALRWMVTFLKRRGSWDEAIRLLDPWKRGSVWAGIEVAKYLEHRRKSYAEALAVVEEFLQGRDSGAVREELVKRRDRLVWKIGGRA